uniref:Stp1/IreP family PP2C-type Ser/Thr phosphatase n=1 Tax=uncultured Allobacillus sp. TaxID=1638025 RepID=UPI0025959A98|nr:Stp1/IreP family PP2C-type Ser/Thr phosphatase [uncultured Allobacillus sp.]
MTAYFKSDRGKVRSINEDAGGIFKHPSGQLLTVIADGMGGHNAGDVASQMAVSQLHKKWEETSKFSTIEVASMWLEQTILEANQKIHNYSKENVNCEGMGTTLTAAIILKNEVAVGHIGDSRLYTINHEEIVQQTEDHSFVHELVRNGQLTMEEAEVHPKKNVLTQAVGTEESLDVQLHTFSLNEDKPYLFLCTDGLTNKVSEEEIQEVILQDNKTEDKLDELIRLANDRGGEDNISLLLWVDNGDEEGVSTC